jgi:cysteine desulfurase / selenocysteine lyase
VFYPSDFPGLNGITYLDSAASSQTPNQVVQAMTDYYQGYRANVHRGAYALSSRATEAYEEARHQVAQFLSTKPEQCIFTRGTTDSINMLAQTLCRGLQPGQRIALSTMEHHSNLVPWQQWAQALGLELDWIEVNEKGHLDPQSLAEVLDRKPAILSLTWVSNVMGTINPIADIAKRCREQGTIFVVDGAQGVPHMATNVEGLGCDFLAFSGHKMLGPTGIGVLWGRKERLKALPPYQFGGSMVGLVTREKTTFAPIPQRFEAGTPPIAEAIGLGAAVEYLKNYGMDDVRQHEKQLLAYALERLATIPGLQILGPADPEQQSGVVSFRLTQTSTGTPVHPHDIATILDRDGICVRAGHHCCQPLMRHFTPADSRAPISVVRASFYLYNSQIDVDHLMRGLRQSLEVFQR